VTWRGLRGWAGGLRDWLAVPWAVLPRPVPAPVPPRRPEPARCECEGCQLLRAAIEAARPRCTECGNDRVIAEHHPGTGPVPVSHHWARTPDEACAVLSGGEAAWLAHEDLWAALEPHLLVADYGETAWSRRQLAAVAS